MTQPPPPPPGPQQPPAGQYGATTPGVPPYPPYGQAPAYPAPPPPRQGMSGGMLATIVVGVVLLVSLGLCGGAFALGVLFFRGFEDLADEWDPDRVGGRNNPVQLEEGEAFSIDGMEYTSGWEVLPGPVEVAGISGLDATNEREEEDAEYVSLTFTFLADGIVVGEVSCDSDGVVDWGQVERLDCFAFDRLPAAFDEIEVYAS